MRRADAGDVAFAPGRRVTIRSIDEIFATLDGEGTSDGLVFMREMARYCGKTLEVLDRVDITCVESGGLRGFEGEEVYLLRDVLCDGAEHDGCQKACFIFWKRSWLTDAERPHMASPAGGEPISSRLRTRTEDGRYFCQSSNLLYATRVLSRVQKLRVGLHQLRTGKASLGLLLYGLGLGLLMRVGRLLRLRRPAANGRKNYLPPPRLQRGDCVKTKTLHGINETLDANGCNRGLAFTRYMRSDCGKSLVVRSPLRRIILETTGEMRHIKNTVLLEDSICHGATPFAICPRRQFHFWREDWLTPSQPRSTCSARPNSAAPAE